MADRREQALLLEEQDLRQELAMCKSNLEKAEDEVPFTSFALLSLLSEHNQKTALNVYLKSTWKLVKKLEKFKAYCGASFLLWNFAVEVRIVVIQ